MPADEPSSRRQRILDVSARLFREHGYHGVGIDDIGAAAGISGPGVYRHFAGKQAVLAELVEQAGALLVATAKGVRGKPGTPRHLLDDLVGSHVALVLDHRDRIAVLELEERNLPPAEHRAARRRQRQHVEEWARTLTPLRPDLPEKDARVVVQGALALASAFAVRDSGVDRTATRALVERMVLAALLSKRAPR